MQTEHFDPFSGGWQPGTTVFLPGYGAMLLNRSANPFQVQISGFPAYPPNPLQLDANVPALVGRQTPGPATFQDIVGYPPQNGTTVTRILPGQGQADYTFSNGAWQPVEPVAQLGEAVWITLPCLYLGSPSNLVVEATSSQGAAVQYPITATSYCGGQLTVNCTPAPGSVLPLGTSAVDCQADDGLGNSAYCSFTVTVVDTTPPVTQSPSNLVVQANLPGGATVFFNVTAFDLVDRRRA
jgi:hypothetical protein